MFRDSDPATSCSAAAEVPVLKARRIAMTAAMHLCQLHGSCTANEIGSYGAGLASHNAETIRKRVHELVVHGVLIPIGCRTCRITGKCVTDYRIRDTKNVSQV